MPDTHMVEVRVKNGTTGPISNVFFYHRYGDSYSDVGCIMNETLEQGKEVTIGEATFDTGMGALGRDTWWMQFERNGQKFVTETDFQCTIREDDAKTRRPVVLEVQDREMKVMLPHSGGEPCGAKVETRKSPVEMNAR